MSNENAGVAILNTHIEAENAVKELQRAGFDMKKLSIIGKNYHTEENVVGYYNTGDRMLFWGKLGAFWGGIWGILFGSAFLMVPGIGQLLAAGPIVSSIIVGLEGAFVAGGVSALGAGLLSSGIPKDSIIVYETALKSEKFVLVIHGSADEVSRAKDVLNIIGHNVQLHFE